MVCHAHERPQGPIYGSWLGWELQWCKPLGIRTLPLLGAFGLTPFMGFIWKNNEKTNQFHFSFRAEGPGLLIIGNPG